MPRGSQAQRDIAFMRWRDLHFAKTLRDAVNRGVRYAGMGRAHMRTLVAEGLPPNTRAFDMVARRPDGLRGPDQKTGHECDDAVSEPTGTTAYPNVRLRLRRTTHAPNAPDTDAVLMLWLSGSRFRLRDEAGRSYPAILADVAPGRGLGEAARSIEDLMRPGVRPPGPGRRRRSTPTCHGPGDCHRVRRPAMVRRCPRLAGLADQVFSHALRRTPNWSAGPAVSAGRVKSTALRSWARRTACPTGARCGGGCPRHTCCAGRSRTHPAGVAAR